MEHEQASSLSAGDEGIGGEADPKPDDFDIHAPEFVRDPYAHYANLRERCPVAHGERYGAYWLLTRYEDVRSAARDWRAFTSSVPGVTSIPAASRRTAPQLPLELDPPLHSRYRALVNPVFAPARVERLRPRVEALGDGLVDTVLARLQAGEVVDLVAEYAVPLSVGALAAFTGLPPEDSHLWVEWERRMFDVQDRADGARASQEMSAYIERLIAERKRTPPTDASEDFISLLLTSEVEGHRLTDREIHAFCQLQFGAGFETTADAMSVSLHYLATHPQAREQLKVCSEKSARQATHPQAREQLPGAPDLLSHAVEEFLRYVTPIQIFGRNAAHDLTLHDQPIPKGDIVAISYGSANHDPAVFPDPERCVLDRFAGAGAPRHLTFGSGIHLCLGAPVARLELGLTLRAFTSRVPPLQIVPPNPVAYPAAIADQEGTLWKPRGDRRGLASLPVKLKRA